MLPFSLSSWEEAAILRSLKVPLDELELSSIELRPGVAGLLPGWSDWPSGAASWTSYCSDRRAFNSETSLPLKLVAFFFFLSYLFFSFRLLGAL